MESFRVTDRKRDEGKPMIAAALDHLMHYMLTGCGHSARHAAYLLDKLSADTGIDEETRSMCCHACRHLEENCTNGVSHG